MTQFSCLESDQHAKIRSRESSLFSQRGNLLITFRQLKNGVTDIFFDRSEFKTRYIALLDGFPVAKVTGYVTLKVKVKGKVT